MLVGKYYSHKNGQQFIETNYKAELEEVIEAIGQVNATEVLTKQSEEKSKPPLIFSPENLNITIKKFLCPKGWTKSNKTSKKGFTEPKLYWNSAEDKFEDKIGQKTKGSKEFREMDGLKNKVGLEIQFGKYAFMGYDIFSKMPIFSKRGLIVCGIEVVVMPSLIRHMSTGVSSFSQIVMDMKARGEADLDIPTLVIGIECSETEWAEIAEKRRRYKENPQALIDSGEVSAGRKGAKPGPK